MFKLDRKALTYLVAAIGVLGAGAALIAAGPVVKSWHDTGTLTRAHITYIQYPCTDKDPDVPCPAYRLDLYGDGSVTFRSLGGTQVPGNYRYHVDAAPVRDYMRDFAVSGFWDAPVPAGPNRYGGACLIVMQLDGQMRKNGCLKWHPGTDQAMDDASVNDNVKVLEALSLVHSLALGDDTTPALLARAKSIRPEKNTLQIKSDNN